MSLIASRSRPRWIIGTSTLFAAALVFTGVGTANAASTIPAPTSSRADPYPQFLFEAHDRVNPNEGALDSSNVSALRIRWTHPLGGPYAAPVVAGGLTFEAGYNGTVEAFSAASGRVLWTYQDSSPIVAAPAVGHSVLFVGDKNGVLSALDIGTGRLLWTGDAGDQFFDPDNIAVSGGVVYTVTQPVLAGTGIGTLSAWGTFGCGAATCRPLWTASLGGPVEAGAAVADGVVFVDSADGYLNAFPAYGCYSRSCKPLWRGVITGVPSNDSYGSISVAGRFVYVGGQNSPVKAFRVSGCGSKQCLPVTGFDSGSIGVANIAVAQGTLYIGAAGGLEAFDARCPPATICEPIWTDTSVSYPTVFEANGIIYGSSSTVVFADSATNGRRMWQAPIPGSSQQGPVVAYGTVYLGSTGGNRLLAYHLPGS
jgi:hypothetical protein